MYSLPISCWFVQALKKGSQVLKITKGMFSKKRTSVKWIRLSDDLTKASFVLHMLLLFVMTDIHASARVLLRRAQNVGGRLDIRHAMSGRYSLSGSQQVQTLLGVAREKFSLSRSGLLVLWVGSLLTWVPIGFCRGRTAFSKNKTLRVFDDFSFDFLLAVSY